VSVGDVFVFVGAVLIMAAGLWRSVELWRHSTTVLDGWPAGMLRAFPVVIVCTSVFLAFGMPIVVLHEQGDEYGASSQLAGVVAAVALLASVGLGISLGLRGRPRALVPPYLRDWDLPAHYPPRLRSFRDR
jgi:hypothetical protein